VSRAGVEIREERHEAFSKPLVEQEWQSTLAVQ
jgi:hypothetical protein